jgi:hypothetical protein
MRSDGQLVRLGLLLAIVSASSALPVLAATPSFTIAATNVTMSSATATGAGTSTFTLTSVNGYAGTIAFHCGPASASAGAKVPICGGGGPVEAYSLAANQVVTGSIGLINSCDPCPVSLPHRGGRKLERPLAPGLALAGALLFGIGFRRRAARWLTLTLLAVGALAGLAGISACGVNNNVVTPGTYVYTVTAEDISTTATVTTSVNVTVP